MTRIADVVVAIVVVNYVVAVIPHRNFTVGVSRFNFRTELGQSLQRTDGPAPTTATTKQATTTKTRQKQKQQNASSAAQRHRRRRRRRLRRHDVSYLCRQPTQSKVGVEKCTQLQLLPLLLLPMLILTSTSTSSSMFAACLRLGCSCCRVGSKGELCSMLLMMFTKMQFEFFSQQCCQIVLFSSAE